MAKFQLTNKAVEDLNEIWDYTFDKWSEKQAEKYYFQIMEFCKEIAENPKIGKNYDGIQKDLFGLKANRHIIFYRNLENEPIEITRILHGRMDLKRRIIE
ncbi:type II toxin-antitoxin system RelE/ParE family toxin [Hyunsoonleella pacifica]|uniref:Toxin n=1 Tax=Hyunsoonleella pacifica TaxID=1080224 RepID=A0A4Q9FSH0_9FLAO|nr:type II toxin-antitoxin system RelE/ParE family toxin [Hyunsoonleella pacifica]TBN19078.1 type II toxin-antitoxin system RelE/ParE family toxin [Hyunsoonleella pacifica]GGD07161.1 plasmid stabilization protein ParE [Hyunsoonleella pacifica]